MTLLAVGGYGRRHLFPYSDVDLLLLVENGKLGQDAREPISAFLQTLWDAGLRLSHSVRTPEECAEIHDQNIELNVSLLDQRFLAGDRALYARFAERLPRFLHAQRDTLMRNLTRLTRERHQKYQNTYYHLEPNIKDTPGGLRDYQLVRWLAHIRDVEVPEMEPAFLFLARLRCYLHARAGRDNNALSFDAQEQAAEYVRRSRSRAMDARLFPPCAGSLSGGSAGIGIERSAVELPVRAIQGLADAAFQCRFHACRAIACTCACRRPWKPIRNWRCACFSSWRATAFVLPRRPSSG